jgi:hypothetical protein
MNDRSPRSSGRLTREAAHQVAVVHEDAHLHPELV